MLGPPLIHALDRRFAGAPPQPTDEWRLWLKAVLACGLSAGLLGVLMLIGSTTALAGWFVQLAIVTVVWFVAGPVTEYLRRARSPRST